MFQRLCTPSLTHSFFLFGARGTGKTNLIKQLFSKCPHYGIDLLDDMTARQLRRDPSRLKARFASFAREQPCQWIVLDEVQRAPAVLNTVHQMIEKDKVLFALTGSSARKLKRGGANLLAGRAFVYHLFPLTFVELASSFNVADILTFGSLPQIFSYQDALDKKKYLMAYIQTYVKEEIQAEQIVRQLDPFQDFLQVSAQMSSKVINHCKIARDVGVDPKTVATYFNILEETWMGFRLPGFHTSIRKAQVYSPKFYWFDLGVRRALENNLDYAPAPGTSYFGECFEELVVNEIYRLNHYLEKNYRMYYLATSNSEVEVDVVLEKGRGREIILVEIKASTTIDERKVRMLSKLKENFPSATAYYLSQATESLTVHDVQCMAWQAGLKRIFGTLPTKKASPV